MALPTSGTWISSLQNCERRRFCFKPFSLWSFVMAALGNEYSYHIWCSLKWFSEENTLIGPGPVLASWGRCCRSSWKFTEGYQATLSVAFTRPRKSALNWGQRLSPRIAPQPRQDLFHFPTSESGSFTAPSSDIRFGPAGDHLILLFLGCPGPKGHSRTWAGGHGS